MYRHIWASRVAQLVRIRQQCRRPQFDSWVEKFPREGIALPLQYSWASQMAQIVKNPPAMWKTYIQSLSWEDPLEEGLATHSSILVWKTPMDRGAWWATVHGVAKSQTWLTNSAQHSACAHAHTHQKRKKKKYNLFPKLLLFNLGKVYR